MFILFGPRPKVRFEVLAPGELEFDTPVLEVWGHHWRL